MLLRKIGTFFAISTQIGVAIADNCEFFQHPMESKLHPIVRLEYSYLTINTFDQNGFGTNLARLPSPYNGLGFSGGFIYDKYVGLQMGYQYYFDSRRITETTNGRFFIGLRPEMWYGDVMGYLNMLHVKGLYLVGSAGAIVNDFSFILDNRTTGATTYMNNVNVNIRLGIGMRYAFSRHWGVDWMYHIVPNHINSRRNGAWKEFWTVDLGLSYQVY